MEFLRGLSLQTLLRRYALFLSVLVAGLGLGSATVGIHGAGRPGVFLSANGYRSPIYGISRIHDASGRLGTSCARLSQAQVEAARVGRHVSNAMLAQSPRATIQATSTGATFEIIYSDPPGTGFNDAEEGQVRRAALQAATAAWSKVIQGTVTIKVEATMKPAEPNEDGSASSLLASAGPVDYQDIDGKSVPYALAWQLLNRRVKNDGTADISVDVNEDVDWDFALDGQAEEGTSSFVYTLIHELGHGLGFIDSYDADTGQFMNAKPFPYDTFLNRGSGSRNLVLSHAAAAIARDVTSGDLFFGGANAVEASRRSIKPLPMIKLYAPDPYEPGSSVAHVDQDTYADFRTGLMCPQDFGSGTDKIDILTLGIIKDLGYQLVANATTARSGQ